MPLRVRRTLETSAVYKDADQSVRLFCMQVETLKASCNLSRAVFPFETKIWKKIYKIHGGLTAYCLIFANPNIHQNTGKFMYFLKQA